VQQETLVTLGPRELRDNRDTRGRRVAPEVLETLELSALLEPTVLRDPRVNREPAAPPAHLDFPDLPDLPDPRDL